VQLESYIYGEVGLDDVDLFIPFLLALPRQPWFRIDLRYCDDTGHVAFSGTGAGSKEVIELFSKYLCTAGLKPGFCFAYTCYAGLADWSYCAEVTESGCRVLKYHFSDDDFGFWMRVISGYPDLFYRVVEESTAHIYGSEFNDVRVSEWMKRRVMSLINL